jgi:hypothetical protein
MFGIVLELVHLCCTAILSAEQQLSRADQNPSRAPREPCLQHDNCATTCTAITSVEEHLRRGLALLVHLRTKEVVGAQICSDAVSAYISFTLFEHIRL